MTKKKKKTKKKIKQDIKKLVIARLKQIPKHLKISIG